VVFAKGERVREIDTDYLIVGAGATGVAFADSLIAESDARVVIVDRRHRPGGHWLDAYPFVRLHQPSAIYGVNSRPLGHDRIDESGINAGFYERATASEISDYFNRVLEDHVASGRVRFMAMSDYRGADDEGHHVVSLLTGADTTVRVRRRFVDATYTESSIPSRHIPSFVVDEGVRLVPPNDLVDVQDTPSGFTVIGAGKTAMDTCNWLLDEGVDPGRIRWIRPRDGWLFNRAFFQPLAQVGSYMQLQARWVEAAANAATGSEFAHRMEADDVLVRIDRDREPEVFRGPTVSIAELDALRKIGDVVRLGRVLRVGRDEVTLADGTIAADPGQVYVDCSAAGVRPTQPRPIFEPGRITLQYVTIGIVPYSAATTGAVEAMRDDDDDKNRLCPVVVFTGLASDLLRIAYQGMTGLAARGAESDLAEWDSRCRLNPARGASDHLDDPRVPAAFQVMAENYGAAMRNLSDAVAAPPVPA
jgi:hypothetical protein